MPPPSRQVAGGALLAPANAMSWRLWPGDEHLWDFVCFFKFIRPYAARLSCKQTKLQIIKKNPLVQRPAVFCHHCHRCERPVNERGVLDSQRHQPKGMDTSKSKPHSNHVKPLPQGNSAPGSIWLEKQGAWPSSWPGDWASLSNAPCS